MNPIRFTALHIKAADAGLPASIMYLPEGDHTIRATVGGKPKTVRVKVDASILGQFEQDLATRLADNVRPFIDFDHERKAAAAIPRAFRYVKGEGLYLDLDWTEAGRAAVEGKTYSYFSPEFLLRAGKPAGLTAVGPLGALVNDPAFRNITRIAAKQASDTMEDFQTALVTAGVLPENQELDGTAAASIVAALSTARAEAQQARDALTAAETARDEAQAALRASRETAADAALADAVRAGRIPAKDDALRAFWRDQLIADPDKARAALCSIPASAVLDPVLDNAAARRQPAGQEESRAAQIRAKAAKLQTGGMRFSDAWAIASRSVD